MTGEGVRGPVEDFGAVQSGEVMCVNGCRDGSSWEGMLTLRLMTMTWQDC
jgi:hypothetical protein